MAKIPEKMRWIYDLLLTAAILAMATVLCTLLRRIDDGSGYVNLIFVLTVATISRWTEGYFWGIFSAVSGVLFVNYVFTYPYWEFNFTITGYPFTFLAMLTVSMMISAMNTQIKKQERLRIETEKEAVRANLLRAMSHDIRTPLTSIVGNTAAILENEDSFSPEQKRRLLEDVNEDAQWLIRMVENLLSITRMSGGQAKIEKDCEAAEEIVGVEGDELLIRRRLEHGVETVACRLPLVMTVNGTAPECRPRHAKLVMKYKHAITPSECQLDQVGCYAQLRESRPYLNITEWGVADVDADDTQLGLSGSPTKVKKIENVVFAAKEAKRLSADDADIDSLIKELIASHTLG